MAYVIRRQDGMFVAPAGSKKSYTRALQNARQFRTRLAAERECCTENERVCSLDDAMNTEVR